MDGSALDERYLCEWRRLMDKEVLSLDGTCTSMSEAERISTGLKIVSLGHKAGQISAQLQL